MFEVAIVGFGPVGAVAANLLGRAGVRTVVIDKTDQVFEKPRAIAFDHEVMRVFQNIGVADAIAPYLGPYVPTDYLGSDGRPIARFASKPGPTKLGWQPNYVFNQPEVERVVRRAASGLESLTFYLDHELFGVHQSADGPSVSLTVRSRGNVAPAIEARYVIACDGANSFLRRSLGVPLDSLEFDKPFLVVDALVEEPALSRLPAVNVQHCSPARPSTYIIGPGGHRRWEIMLLDGERPEAVSEAESIAALLSRWISPGEAIILRAATYNFHALYARTLRVERIFLAGDAAHQTPPFMGQGMAQGIRDVANLTWKLDRVLRGSADPSLLDTYQEERVAHTIKTTERAVALGKVICELDPGAAAQRDKSMRLSNGDPPRMQYRQDLIPPLEFGFASPKLANVSGELAPQPSMILEDGTRARLDDVSGTDFRVIALAEFASSFGPEQIGTLAAVGIKLVVLASDDVPAASGSALTVHEEHGYAGDWLRGVGCSAILVRPDHYIYAGVADWSQLDAAISQLIQDMGIKPTAFAGGPTDILKGEESAHSHR